MITKVIYWKIIYIINNYILNIGLGLIIVSISAFLYGIGILFLFDRAFLMLGNLLFFCGIWVLAGFSETLMFFARHIKSTLALIIGLIFIIIKWKMIGAIIQLYGIFQFVKKYALNFLAYFEWIPFIGPFINKMRNGTLKKNDDINKV